MKKDRDEVRLAPGPQQEAERDDLMKGLLIGDEQVGCQILTANK